MAGRGTDIILGGNPEGLSQLALLRLVYRRLSSSTHRASPEASPGHEEESLAAQAAGGAIAVPRLPLDVFDDYDVNEVSDIVPRTAAKAAAGLPRDLHIALLGALLLAHTQGQAAAAEARAGNPHAQRWGLLWGSDRGVGVGVGVGVV